MNGLPKMGVAFDCIYDATVLGPIRSRLISAAVELAIFDHLSVPRSAEAVAQSIDGHAGNTALLLDGLAAMDLVTKRDGLYENTAAAQAFLVENSPTFIGEMLMYQLRWCCDPLDYVLPLIARGPPSAPTEALETDGMWARVARAMASWEQAGGAQLAVQIVSDLPEFSRCRKVLDLGGGPGIIGVAIVAAHPSARGVIFDRPEVANVARDVIKEHHMEDRIDVLAGDYNQDPIGEGYDLVWASASLNFAKHDIDSVTRKIHDALNPGGVLVSLHDGLTHGSTKPEEMVLAWMGWAMTGMDMAFEQGDIAASMLRVGFESVGGRTLDAPMGPMDLEIGRKAETGSGTSTS
ncbi:class I SAM-dependent methyltransferase [bacterium]|nr:class I SAM-dependent methyltransferase [bacterium]